MGRGVFRFCEISAILQEQRKPVMISASRLKSCTIGKGLVFICQIYKANLLERRPIHLTFFVTRRCNSKCPFCFYLKGNISPDVRPELSLDEIEKISASMGDLLWLSFSGGEFILGTTFLKSARLL